MAKKIIFLKRDEDKKEFVEQCNKFVFMVPTIILNPVNREVANHFNWHIKNPTEFVKKMIQSPDDYFDCSAKDKDYCKEKKVFATMLKRCTDAMAIIARMFEIHSKLLSIKDDMRQVLEFTIKKNVEEMYYNTFVAKNIGTRYNKKTPQDRQFITLYDKLTERLMSSSTDETTRSKRNEVRKSMDRIREILKKLEKRTAQLLPILKKEVRLFESDHKIISKPKIAQKWKELVSELDAEYKKICENVSTGDFDSKRGILSMIEGNFFEKGTFKEPIEQIKEGSAELVKLLEQWNNVDPQHKIKHITSAEQMSDMMVDLGNRLKTLASDGWEIGTATKYMCVERVFAMVNGL